jgi:transcriptional regulator with XRE-family HTH domain
MNTTVADQSQEDTGERLRRARVTASDRSVREIGKAAKALGISRQSLYRYERDARDVPLRVLRAAAATYGVGIGELVGEESPASTVPRLLTREQHMAMGKDVLKKAELQDRAVIGKAFPNGRAFADDQDKMTFAIVSLALAEGAIAEAERHRLLAMAALLSPVTAPTQVAPGPTAAELVAKHADATRTAAATTAAQAPAAAKAKGRR